MQLTIALSAMLGDMVQQVVPHLSAQENVRAAGTRCQTRVQVRVQMTALSVLLVGMGLVAI